MRRSAARDPRLRARILERRPLRYAGGADPATDRPPHVRAASALARVGGRLAVIQDDANFIALLRPPLDAAVALMLPAGAGGRRQFDDRLGNKQFKLDLEACATAPGERGTLLVAFGSGSSPQRERVVLVEGWESPPLKVEVRDAPALYASLRREETFAGSDLNVEGAVFRDGRLWLFARGNGAPREGLRPVNAACALDWPALMNHLRDPVSFPSPEPENVVQYDLGSLDGVPLGFTDALGRGPGFLFVAAAEESPDARRDGRVIGSVIGIIDARDGARWTPILDETGSLFRGKVEGLAPSGADGTRVCVVVDRDDPGVPSELCLVELSGGWPAE